MGLLFMLFALILLTGCGGNTPPATIPPLITTTTGGGGAFTLTISGDLTAEVESTAAYLNIPDQGISLPLYAVDAPPGTTASGVTLVMPSDITPGTYPIEPYYNAFDANSQITGVGATFAEPASGQTGNRDLLLTEVIEGTLTLTNLDPLSGNAVFLTGDDEWTIQVNVVFNDIPQAAAP